MTVLDQLNLCQDYSHISPSLCRASYPHTHLEFCIPLDE
jgi:hypothetical protein